MRFYDLCSDENWIVYGGMWYAKHNYPGGHDYYVIEFLNYEQETGETYKDDHRYCVEIKRLDFTFYGGRHIVNALSSCGMEYNEKLTEIELLYPMIRYGYGDHVDVTSGNNAYKLLKQAKDSCR